MESDRRTGKMGGRRQKDENVKKRISPSVKKQIYKNSGHSIKYPKMTRVEFQRVSECFQKYVHGLQTKKKKSKQCISGEG